jgi:hypothetical protein
VLALAEVLAGSGMTGDTGLNSSHARRGTPVG